MRVLYNIMFRILLKLLRFRNASSKFADACVDYVYAMKRKISASLMKKIIFEIKITCKHVSKGIINPTDL